MTSDERESFTGHLTVDGIEGRYARVELDDGTVEDWPLSRLPRGVREGDVVSLHVEGGDLSMEIDHEATRERRHAAQSQLDALNQAAPVGEINL